MEKYIFTTFQANDRTQKFSFVMNLLSAKIIYDELCFDILDKNFKITDITDENDGSLYGPSNERIQDYIKEDELLFSKMAGDWCLKTEILEFLDDEAAKLWFRLNY